MRIRNLLTFPLALSLVLIPLPASVATPVTLTVFAASSLTTTYTDLAKIFMKSHKNWRVSFSFLASSTLATQLNAGAPADLFVSASTSDMALAKARVEAPINYVSNRVVLAFKTGGKVKTFNDLNMSSIKWIQCAHEVPCGMTADAALRAEGGIISKPVSYESKVSSAVTKLVTGEVDAAIIYHTDVLANSKTLSELEFSEHSSALTLYQIGLVTKSRHAAVSKIFLNFLLSDSAIQIMKERGFEYSK